jgi:hypothetical protein
MPLLFDQYSIDILNGPVSFSYMRPKNPLFYPMLLFGDIHTMTNFKRCDNPNCFEIQTDFVYTLNEFAKKVRTEFYMEGFMLPQLKQTAKEIQKVYRDIRNDPANEMLHKEKHGLLEYQITSPSETKQAEQIYRKKYKHSNLTEMMAMYYSCFYPDVKGQHCPFKNINWHFADTRYTDTYRQESKHDQMEHIEYYGSYISELFNVFADELDKDSPNVSYILDILPTSLRKAYIFSNEEMAHFLEFAILLFEDYGDNVIPKILSSVTIKKQYDKLSEPMKKILTPESFIQFFKWRLKYFETHKSLVHFYSGGYYAIIMEMFRTLYNYYNEASILDLDGNSHTGSYDMIRNTACERLIDINVDEYTVYVGEIMSTSLHSILLDIYFILRSHKIDNREQDQKLVCGYFGSRHIDCIRHYYTKIIKTHTDTFFTRTMTGERRVHITKTIDLNAIFGYKQSRRTTMRIKSKEEWEQDMENTIKKIEFRMNKSKKQKYKPSMTKSRRKTQKRSVSID